MNFWMILLKPSFWPTDAAKDSRFFQTNIRPWDDIRVDLSSMVFFGGFLSKYPRCFLRKSFPGNFLAFLEFFPQNSWDRESFSVHETRRGKSIVITLCRVSIKITNHDEGFIQFYILDTKSQFCWVGKTGKTETFKLILSAHQEKKIRQERICFILVKTEMVRTFVLTPHKTPPWGFVMWVSYRKNYWFSTYTLHESKTS